MPLVLDTGPILALLDADDPDHKRCLVMVDEIAEDLVVPAPVLVEVDYWVLRLLDADAWTVFIEDLARGAYRLHNLDEDDLVRVAELESIYASLELGLVDAAVVATCERLGEAKVATLDRGHFSVVRPRHCDALHLLPD